MWLGTCAKRFWRLSLRACGSTAGSSKKASVAGRWRHRLPCLWFTVSCWYKRFVHVTRKWQRVRRTNTAAALALLLPVQHRIPQTGVIARTSAKPEIHRRQAGTRTYEHCALGDGQPCSSCRCIFQPWFQQTTPRSSYPRWKFITSTDLRRMKHSIVKY